MAEFKLGRIRFVWQGTWTPNTPYVADDVVSNGGKSYICTVNHTSSLEFASDVTELASKWDVVSDGTSWKGDWSPETAYNAGDLVKYGALVYVCSIGHTSDTYEDPTYNGLEPDFDKWTTFATSFDWKGAWAPNTRYRQNDIVRYGAYSYICNVHHISAATEALGIEPNLDKWSLFNDGVAYLGEWTDSVRYKVNDVVKYGGDLWICTTYHTSASSFDDAKWEVFLSGFQFENSWDNATNYQIGDTVTYGGYSYVAKTNNINKQPTTNVSDWDVFTTGFKFQGDWSSSTAYKVGDVIRIGGTTYVALLDSANQPPPNDTYWSRLNSGIAWTNNSQSYTQVAGTTVTGLGAGARFDVTRSKTTYTVTVSAGFGGSGYSTGNTIKILGSSVGGLVPSNDILITVTSTNTGAITGITSSGYSSTWKSGVTYVVGDAVLFGASSYICVQTHTAGTSSRPDNDTAADYWNLLALGSEAFTLTTEGDLLYYGPNGPARLPVGYDGQIIRATDGFPAWANYGLINNVVYVGPLGTDIPAPDSGLTIDRPWKTVRYAAKQIEDGYQYPNAKALLRKNKQFLLKEVNNFLSYTYRVSVSNFDTSSYEYTANSTAGLTSGMPIVFDGTAGGITAGTTYYVKTIVDETHFTISNTQFGLVRALTGTPPGAAMTGTLDYDQEKAERDALYAVEAVIYDVCRGGSLKTTTAANAYYTAAGNAYISTGTKELVTQFVAAQNYLKTLIVNVLGNTAPASNYQTLNGVAVGSRVQQIIDTTLVAESEAIAKAQDLIAIITTGLEAGSATAIAPAFNPNTTIYVKTGTYQEVAPIVVPEYTALVGDELRTSVIQPAFAVDSLVNDKSKTISALNRIKAITPALVANTEITPTAGNASSQVYVNGFAGDAAVVSSVNAKSTIISDIVTNGLGSIPLTVIADPVGYDTGYYNARRLIVANKQFLKDEVTAYMNTTAPYSTLWASLTNDQKTACTRDIGYIVDALQYDLTYITNLETVVVARSYYSNGTFVENSNEKAAALAVQTHIKSIIDDIAQGIAITPSSGNVTAQTTSGTAGSPTAAAFAQARIQEIYDTIDTGVTPDEITPDLSWVSSGLRAFKDLALSRKTAIQSSAVDWVIKTYPNLDFNHVTCNRDVGYIVDAIAYDVMFDSNFRSIKAGAAYYRATVSAQTVIADQKVETAGIVQFINSYMQDLASGYVGSVGTTTAVNRVIDAAEVIKNVINSGTLAIPSLKLPNPTNYGSTLTNTAYAATGNLTGSTSTYDNARTQIVQNYAFIKAELAAYMSTNYSSVWTAMGTTGQASTAADTTSILDAIRYDITYGGNTQSLIAGSAYYSNYIRQIRADWLTAVLDTLARLKTVIGLVATKSNVTVTPGNAVSQVVTGSAGNAASAVFVQNRVQDVIDWINNATANSTIAPATSWTDSELQLSFSALIAKKAEVQNDMVLWTKKYFQDISFNETVCYRDAGLMVDAVAYDMLFNSNFASIVAGRSYYRNTTSSNEVLTNEKEASVGAANFLKHKLKRIAAVSSSVAITTTIDDIVSYINGGAVPAIKWPVPSTTAAGYAGAATLIWDNKEFIKAEVVAYIAANYPAVVYDQATCTRDVGFIVDALRYDLVYGGNYASKQAGKAYYSFANLQIDSNDKTATLAAYGYLKTLVQTVAVDSAVSSPLQGSVTQVRADTLQTVGSGAAATAAGGLVDVITNIIDNGLTVGAPTVTITTIASGTTFTTSSAHGLAVGDEIIPTTASNGMIAGQIYYVASIPLTTTFTLAASYGGSAITSFANGTGLSIVAEKTSMPVTTGVNSSLLLQYKTLSSSKASIVSTITSFIQTNYPTLTYNSTTCERDVKIIIDSVGFDMMLGSNFLSTKAGISYYRAAASLAVGVQKTATVAAFRKLKTTIKSYIYTDSTATARANTLMDVIVDIVVNGQGDTPETTGTVTYNNSLAVIKGAEVLRANKEFLANEATAWISLTYGGTISETNGTTNVFTTSAAHNLVTGDPIVFTLTGTDNNIGISYNRTYYVLADSLTGTTFKITSTQGSLNEVDINTVATPNSKVTYAYDAASCRRDMREYIESIIQDLEYTGNYRSLRSARLYLNAVDGSTKSDLFYVRNSTGLRNMTFNGLSGDLTEENEYGTKRPTAGAAVSLDPGFGPADTRAWISNKSPYVQNVTNFGAGCTGLKIDGALHGGGNRSVVANDFTQILSDGVGVWCSGADSLTELVSVFCYYTYSGYLADLGGRIRATNGNSSYGVYGVIAEGTDTSETPLVASLNNHAQQAQITDVITDGENKVLRFEYANAGTHYSNTVHTISGSGFNATATADEFRDSAVFETRLIDVNDGNGYGGKNYGTAINAAQNGTTTYITIANTDTALSSAYVGMRIQLTAGSGVGQYANILAYNNGTKVALVYKDSFDALTATATTGASDLITVNSNASLYADMPIYFSGTAFGNLTSNTLYYVKALTGTTQFTVYTNTITKAQIDLIDGSGTLTVLAAGWDHVVPGTALTTPLDLTTSYVIEPRISYTAPGYTATARSSSATSAWGPMVYANSRFVSLTSSGTATQYSTDGKTWTAGGTVASASWTDVVFGGGYGATATAVVGGLGGSGAVLQAVLGQANSIGLPGVGQVASITIVDGGHGYTTPPTIVISGTGAGAVATCTVRDGVIQEVILSSNGSGYSVAPNVSVATDRVTDIIVNSWGSGYTSAPTITLTGGGSSNQATATATLTNTGVSSISIGNSGGSGYTSTPTVTITDTNAKYVAIANGSTASTYLLASSAANANWTAGNALPASTFTSLAYGNGIYVAVGGTNGAASSTDGITWVSRTNQSLSAGTYSGLAFGNGVFVAISTSNNQTSYSTNGIVWTLGGNLPSTTTWTSVTYGNGRFVAVANGPSRTVAYSLDNGLNWVLATPGLPSSQSWTTVRYGQGLFFALAQGTTVAATSPDGINWTTRTMPGSATNWKGLAFGNPSATPIWAATSITSGTQAASINTGARTLGRMAASSGVLQKVKIVEPGSGYPKGSVTATTVTTNLITVSSTENLVDNQPVMFVGVPGLTSNVTYYVISGSITSTQFKVSVTSGSSTAVTLSTQTGLTGSYTAGPIFTQYDPNKTVTAALQIRTGNGVLGNPSFSNRGTGNVTATAETAGDGYADWYQPSTYISVSGLFSEPVAGSNVEFASIPNTWYKLVYIRQVTGEPGNYSATLQISPGLSVLNAPAHNDVVTISNKYSQVRLTGHDFLYIGTGNAAQTNFPYVDASTAIQSNQELASGGGRVFFTSTDQDGNFNVGNLFGVQQATGTATLNADAFNLSGLQSLQLGGISVGIGSATITQFSTDPYFTANSDNIVPTQRAIKAYITAQIGGGQSSLNVNTMTSGVVYIAADTITTTSGGQLNITTKMNFTGGVDGAPVALGYFLQR